MPFILLILGELTSKLKVSKGERKSVFSTTGHLIQLFKYWQFSPFSVARKQANSGGKTSLKKTADTYPFDSGWSRIFIKLLAINFEALQFLH